MACGRTRNVTAIFLKYRAEHKRKKNRFQALGAATGAVESLHNVIDRHVSSFDRRTSAETSTADGGRLSAATPDTAGRHQHLLSWSHGRGSASPGTQHGETRIEMAQLQHRVTLPPIWVDIVEETQDSIAQIKERLSALQKAQQRRLLKIFGDESQLRHPDREIERMSDKITELFREAELRVKKIAADRDSHESEAEQKIRRNAQTSLATQLQALSQQYRKQQKQFAAELKKRSGQIESATGGIGQTSASADLLGLDDTSRRQQQLQAQKHGFSEGQIAELQQMEQDIDTRNEEVAHITRSVAEMHTIFKELAVLVIDQGTILDRIDYNVEQVVEQTRQANVHIKKAEEYQKNSRATRVIIFLIVAIILLFCLFIWKHT